MTRSGAEVIIAASPPLAALSACRKNVARLGIPSCLISLSEVYRCAVQYIGALSLVMARCAYYVRPVRPLGNAQKHEVLGKTHGSLRSAAHSYL